MLENVANENNNVNNWPNYFVIEKLSHEIVIQNCLKN